MSRVSLQDAKEATSLVDWSAIHRLGDGRKFPIVLGDEPEFAEKVASEDKEDSDYDRDLMVVVRIRDQYFKKEGYAQVGSHCYGDYEPSWYDLKEVAPRERKVVDFEEV